MLATEDTTIACLLLKTLLKTLLQMQRQIIGALFSHTIQKVHFYLGCRFHLFLCSVLHLHFQLGNSCEPILLRLLSMRSRLSLYVGLIAGGP